MSIKTFEELFLHTLKDVYHGEKQLIEALPKMAKHAQSEALQQAFLEHCEQTKEQFERLKEVFELIDESPRNETCEAIQGLIEEGKEVMKEVSDSSVRDAGLIAVGQAVEHYEIARYGTLVAWGRILGYDAAVALLEKTLQEEKDADERLNQLATAGVNTKAA